MGALRRRRSGLHELGIMMLAWIDRARPKSTAWVCLTLLLAGCASVLGIEDREQDNASGYPAEGYDGCRPGIGCAGCLAVHQQECELRSSCAAAAGSADCASCVCANCTDPVVHCKLDLGCAAIWECLVQSRCDLSARGATSCLTACSGVIDAQGGVGGDAFRAAADVRTCAITSSCLSCLAPEPEPTAGCSKENSCQDCPDCFRECICSGEKFGTCKQSCGTEAPPAACTTENSCAGCSTCFDLCTCGGDGYDHCTSACQVGATPPPVSTCTAATSCSDCDDCASLCVCHGGEAADCASQCATPVPAGVCVQTSVGSESDTCGGCGGCLSGCSCAGTPLEDCMSRCGVGAECDGLMKECVCAEQDTADSCAQRSYSCDDASSCTACACRSCPSQYALCEETPDCPAVFDCMRATRCQGSECAERCGGIAADGVGVAFDAAEALWACNQANSCACETPPDRTKVCSGPNGDLACAAFEGSNAQLPACCANTGGSGTAGGGSSACGLDLRSYLRNAQDCEPLGQGNRPRLLLESCPSRTVFDPPYNGVKLAGCCHAEDNTCGFFDDVTGLGCLSSEIFGIEAGGCGLL
jgi:hypothetical protein